MGRSRAGALRVARFVHPSAAASSSQQVKTTLIRRDHNGTIRQEPRFKTTIHNPSLPVPVEPALPSADNDDQLDNLLHDIDRLLLGGSHSEPAMQGDIRTKRTEKKSKNAKSVSVRLIPCVPGAFL
jgi:hypothetical protein